MSTITPQAIVSHYASYAPHYSRHAELQKITAHELQERLGIINIEINNILDLGCGPGFLSKNLQKRFKTAKLHLLDLSPDMLVLAKKHKPWFRKIELIQENANSMPLADDCMDLVISNLMLQQNPDPDAVFAEVQRVTRENGLFTFTTLGPDSFKELRQAMISAHIDFPEDAFGHLTDMHDIGDALVRNGLREPVLDVDLLKLSYANFSDLWKELLITGCVLQDISNSEMDKLAQSYPRAGHSEDYQVSIEVVYAQAWAGDGKSRARTPDEVHIPLSRIQRR
ncbi:MAG: methyltransferase domain-containing protein [Gammaproteobacteria bacterium]|nr:methyltransferase domain-containing protein [Gammaproteobacteria bacterium]NNC96824.1 methyltransferase domain-containing protein [Gammaproteobacteria bacterium]NNM12892.1 methyltransferase domain-containing protein [Gammaproteobacteria bacterium]